MEDSAEEKPTRGAGLVIVLESPHTFEHTTTTGRRHDDDDGLHSTEYGVETVTPTALRQRRRRSWFITGAAAAVAAADGPSAAQRRDPGKPSAGCRAGCRPTLPLPHVVMAREGANCHLGLAPSLVGFILCPKEASALRVKSSLLNVCCTSWGRSPTLHSPAPRPSGWLTREWPG